METRTSWLQDQLPPRRTNLPSPIARQRIFSQIAVEFAARAGYFSPMRRPFYLFSLCCLLAAALSAEAATGRVIKVLPHFLDLQGRNTLSPSLHERDAYQAFLRQHTNDVSGVCFNVQWKARDPRTAPMKLRVEARGIVRGDLPPQIVLEQEVKPGGWFSHWATLTLTGEEYRKIGRVTAWRVTLWAGDQLLSEQKSFLW